MLPRTPGMVLIYNLVPLVWQISLCVTLLVVASCEEMFSPMCGAEKKPASVTKSNKVDGKFCFCLYKGSDISSLE